MRVQTSWTKADSRVTEILLSLYPWIKALHVIAVISWMAGIFYLPRLFAYHAERAVPGGEMSETFKVMEKKLIRIIMNPAMIVTWICGLAMLATPGIVDLTVFGWIYIKLLLVVVMTWFHHWLSARRKEFERDENTRNGRTYRLMNEVPTLLMIGIVILVIVRPF